MGLHALMGLKGSV